MRLAFKMTSKKKRPIKSRQRGGEHYYVEQPENRIAVTM